MNANTAGFLPSHINAGFAGTYMTSDEESAASLIARFLAEQKNDRWVAFTQPEYATYINQIGIQGHNPQALDQMVEAGYLDVAEGYYGVTRKLLEEYQAYLQKGRAK